MTDSTTGAVILATTDTGFTKRTQLGGVVASLTEVGGQPLAAYVVNACVNATSLGRVVVVSEEDLSVPGADEYLAATSSPVEDMQSGLRALQGSNYAAVFPGNTPFISASDIDTFVHEAVDSGAQMAYPLVPRASCEAALPEFRHGYFRLREGEFTGGNALLLHVPTFLSNTAVLAEAMELRREPWRLALMINPLVLLSYRSGSLSLRDVESAAEKALGIRARAVITDAPALAADIRNPADLRQARKRLEKE